MYVFQIQLHFYRVILEAIYVHQLPLQLQSHFGIQLQFQFEESNFLHK